jgi:hypothetical protein|tara:strand:- start:306 stop:758 length:453 start_codon:yes stop_codon:yes gene_type:complete
MIECTLREIGEYGSALPNYNKRKRQGKYHGSDFYGMVPGYGIKKWVVGVYIDVDYQSYLDGQTSEEEIVKKCIEFLNQPPPRRKYQKKKPQPLYGNIDEKPIRFSFKQDESGTFIEALLVTDQKKNKKFWGAGGVGAVKRKRGRPRKDEQ